MRQVFLSVLQFFSINVIPSQLHLAHWVVNSGPISSDISMETALYHHSNKEKDSHLQNTVLGINVSKVHLLSYITALTIFVFITI
jgi:hypothetical protein